MSKKTNPRSENKQNRKKSRKNRKIVKKVKFRGSKRPLVSPGKYSSKKRHTNKNNNSVYNNTCVNQTTDKNNSKMRKLQSQNRYERVPDSDDVPTTSRSVTGRVSSPKKKFKRSPIKSGFINKFKKIRDDQARRLLRRSRLMMQEKYKPQNGEINICNRRKITSRRSRLAAKRSRLAEKNQQQKSQNSADTSGTSSSSANSTTQIHVDNAATNNDSDDDCVIVEDVPSHVTILDDDDTDDSDNDDSNSSDNNDINYTSAADSTDCYNSISQSFSRRFSSTPSGKKASQANTAKGSFFVDVSSKAYLGNVTYNTVAPLTGNTSSSKGNDDSTVVVVDETVAHSSGTTLQNEGNESDSSSEEEDESDEDGGDMEEDSVIFVSETNSKNFIPLNDNKEDYQSKLKNPPATKTLQYTGQHYSSLLNKNERKELQVYNSNAYNPNAGQILTSKKRMVIIDGSNVAFKHSFDKEFSVKGLTIAIAYFEKMGHEVKAVIPQFRMNQHKSTDPQEMQRLSKAGKIVLTPCKNLPGLTSTSYDDRFILQLASELDAAIVSNDNYRDLLHENTAFKKIIESRVIGYTWCNDIFLLPKDPYGKWGPTLDMILNRS